MSRLGIAPEYSTLVHKERGNGMWFLVSPSKCHFAAAYVNLWVERKIKFRLYDIRD